MNSSRIINRPLRLAVAIVDTSYVQSTKCVDLRCRRPGAVIESLLLSLKIAGIENLELVRVDPQLHVLDVVARGDADVAVYVKHEYSDGVVPYRYTLPITYQCVGYFLREIEDTITQDYMITIVEQSVWNLLFISIIVVGILCAVQEYRTRKYLQKHPLVVICTVVRHCWRLHAHTINQAMDVSRETPSTILPLLLCWLICGFLLSTSYGSLLQSHFVVLKKLGYPFTTFRELLGNIMNDGWRIVEHVGYADVYQYCSQDECDRIRSMRPENWVIYTPTWAALLDTIIRQQKTVTFADSTLTFTNNFNVFYSDFRSKILFVKDTAIPNTLIGHAVSKNIPYRVFERINRGVAMLLPAFDRMILHYSYPTIPYESTQIGMTFSLNHCGLIFTAYVIMISAAIVALLLEMIAYMATRIHLVETQMICT